MKIRNKLFLIFGILIVGLSVFLVQSVLVQIKIVRRMDFAQHLSRFSIGVGSLVHEMQKERARAVAFLDDAGAAVTEELTAQQKRTDAETARVKEYLHHYAQAKISSEFNDHIGVIARNINGLKDIREEINASRVSSRQAVEYYTRINGSFLSALSHLSVSMEDTEFFLGTIAYVNFLYAKENAGVERAVLYDSLINDEFGPWHIEKFISAVTAQETFSTIFLSYATAGQRRYYDDKTQHPSFDEVKKIRDVVLQKMAEGHFGIDPSFWVKTATAKIDVLKEMESYLVDDLTRRAGTARERARRLLVLLLLVNGILAFGAFILFYLMVQKMVNSLGLVVNAAEQVRRGEFKTQITASTTDEIGILIDSFNRMTEELRQTTVSKSYVDNIIANMMNSLIVLTLAGKIISVNKTTCDLLGYQENEMAGGSFKQLFTAEISSNGSWIDALKGGIQNVEAVYRSKEGKEVPVLLSTSLLKDNDGRPQGIICVAQDITKHKETEEVLRIKEEYSRAILETAKDAFIAINEDDIITGWNPHAELVFGWPREEVMGKLLSTTIIPEHYRKAHGEGMKRFIKTGERRILNTTVEVTGLHRDGREFPIELTIWAIQVNGKYQFNAFVRDITERKKAHEALAEREKTLHSMFRDLQEAHENLKQTQHQLVQSEKLASIGQLAAGVAHEINNPVGFINNNMEILEQYVAGYTKIARLAGRIKESVDRGDLAKAKTTAGELAALEKEINLDYILNDTTNLLRHNRAGIERIQKIVMDLRTFAREDKNVMEHVKIEDVIEGVLNIVHSEIKYKAKLEKNYGDTPLIGCNPQRLGQVFLNLIINALHALPDRQAGIEGTGTIEIKTYTQDEFVCVDVRDTGKGIEEKNLGKVFDPFFTTKPVGQGTGLGLSVSHEIVKKHNGMITVVSTPGVGTTFTVSLPINQGKEL